jgi:hypothetical protein
MKWEFEKHMGGLPVSWEKVCIKAFKVTSLCTTLQQVFNAGRWMDPHVHITQKPVSS